MSSYRSFDGVVPARWNTTRTTPTIIHSAYLCGVSLSHAPPPPTLAPLHLNRTCITAFYKLPRQVVWHAVLRIVVVFENIVAARARSKLKKTTSINAAVVIRQDPLPQRSFGASLLSQSKRQANVGAIQMKLETLCFSRSAPPLTRPAPLVPGGTFGPPSPTRAR